MIEGWHGEDYLVLFDKADRVGVSRRYDLNLYLEGFQAVGLLGWDNFIVERDTGGLFTVPAVPLDPGYLAPIPFDIDPGRLRPDDRFRGKVKWYVKPLIFGGDAAAQDNVTWVSHEQHAEAVRWWNRLYLSMSSRREGRP